MHGPHGPGPPSSQPCEHREHGLGRIHSDKVTILEHGTASIDTGQLGKIQAKVLTQLLTLELVETVAKITSTTPEPHRRLFIIGLIGESTSGGEIVNGVRFKAHVQ